MGLYNKYTRDLVFILLFLSIGFIIISAIAWANFETKIQAIDPVQFWKNRYENMSKQFLSLQVERNNQDLIYKIDGKNYECFEIKKLGE